MNSIFTYYSHRLVAIDTSLSLVIIITIHYRHSYDVPIPRLFALPASFALSIRSRCNVRFDSIIVLLAGISARLEYLIVSNIRSSAYQHQ